MHAEEMQKLAEEAWWLTESLNDTYIREWAQDPQNIPLMQRLAVLHKRADTRYWRRADALMSLSEES